MVEWLWGEKRMSHAKTQGRQGFLGIHHGGTGDTELLFVGIPDKQKGSASKKWAEKLVPSVDSVPLW